MSSLSIKIDVRRQNHIKMPSAQNPRKAISASESNIDTFVGRKLVIFGDTCTGTISFRVAAPDKYSESDVVAASSKKT